MNTNDKKLVAYAASRMFENLAIAAVMFSAGLIYQTFNLVCYLLVPVEMALSRCCLISGMVVIITFVASVFCVKLRVYSMLESE